MSTGSQHQRTLQRQPEHQFIRDGPNTVLASIVSNIERSEFLVLTELRGESSVSSSQHAICVPKRTHRVFAKLTKFAAELTEFSLPKQYSRIPPVSQSSFKIKCSLGVVASCRVYGNCDTAVECYVVAVDTVMGQPLGCRELADLVL